MKEKFEMVLLSEVTAGGDGVIWLKRDVKRLQKLMDKCYRNVWSNRNGQPLHQMSERGVNIVDVRLRLGVKSVAWKIEESV